MLKSPSDGDAAAKRQNHYPNDERDRRSVSERGIHFSANFRTQKGKVREERG